MSGNHANGIQVNELTILASVSVQRHRNSTRSGEHEQREDARVLRVGTRERAGTAAIHESHLEPGPSTAGASKTGASPAETHPADHPSGGVYINHNNGR